MNVVWFLERKGDMFMAIDQVRFDEFLGRAVNDMGAAMSGLLVVVGDRLGLYKAMAAAGPMTPAELAKRTGTSERQVREWLNAQASCGYVTYDAASQTLHAAGGTGALLRERGQPRVPAGVLRAARWPATRTSRRSRRPFAAARAWDGTSTTRISSPARTGSSGRAITRIWCPRGFRRSTASRPSCRRARESRMSAADTARRP